MITADRFLFPLLAAIAALALPAVAHAAPAVDKTADYIISLAGANIANVAVTLKDDGQDYSLALKANVTGLGQFVVSGTAEARASGSSAGGTLVSRDFSVETQTRDETFLATVQFDHGEVTGFKVSPPLLDNIGRVPIERSQLAGVGDMLSAFVLKGGRLGPELCRRTLPIFTGIERFDIAMSFRGDDVATSPRTGYQGPVVLCAIKYTPISGHFTTSEITSYLAKSDKLLIWYAPLAGTGYFIPYRVLVGTGIGDLSMVLTGTGAEPSGSAGH